ncbi:pyruvate dehydrogenase E1 component subunit beta-3, chloroplastic-like [Chenopodium quinoa]|uniref:pyruvate dehydrogenase E1 component subunit beta-3, chloroplastic-like n=1 Tax=Chenopodium quinoa TaxID=63459 RepID=UPI000B7887B8|nr:pyruvate dehydrogenase E1 component subunit beta-3, chloroplastic-like [Chenopodium quinoa]
MATSIQSLGASSYFSSVNLIDSRNFHGRKVGFVLVRSDLNAKRGLMSGRCRTGKLVSQAVSTPAASTAPLKTGHEVLLFEALREGFDEEMERDARVCVMGEDVGHYGGSYKVTKGLAPKYGVLRVLDTQALKIPSREWALELL